MILNDALWQAKFFERYGRPLPGGWERYREYVLALRGYTVLTSLTADLDQIPSLAFQEKLGRLNPIYPLTIGPTGVGKTCFWIRYSSNKMPEDYIPSVFGSYSCEITNFVDGAVVNITPLDSPGDVRQTRNRMGFYDASAFRYSDGLSIVILCVDGKEEKMNDARRLLGEFQGSAYGEKIPLVCLLTKVDEAGVEDVLRAQALAKELNCVSFQTCSSMTGKGVKEAVDLFTEIAIHHRLKEFIPKSKVKDGCVSQ
jgi:GTPase SAR1 family protein